MADDEEDIQDGGEEEEEEEGTFSKIGGMFGGDDDDDEGDEEEGTFSKVGGMFGGGDDEGDDEGDGEGEAKDDKPKRVKVKPNTIFDIAALKEFGLSVLTLFIETVIVSVVCVNILFFSVPESIKNNDLNLNKLFPTDRHEWPYCYTNEYTSCEADCGDKFGGIADDPKLDTAKKLYLKAAIILDTMVFKWFCLTKEDIDMVKESVEEGATQVNLLHWDFIKARFKQWINNAFIFSFSSDRAMFAYMFEQLTRLSNAIPVELYDVVSPLLILLMPFVFAIFMAFMLLGGPFFTTVIGMVINETDNRKEYIGGILWSLITGFTLGILPIISYIVRMIQFLGTFFIYPLLHWGQYRELFARYIPIIFFFFNLILMFYAFEYLDINVAAIVILMLLVLYLMHYWSGIMGFFNAIKSWTA